jgi:outer membrane protein assembly factor BamB
VRIRLKLAVLALLALALVPAGVLLVDAAARTRLAIALGFDAPEEAKVWRFSAERASLVWSLEHLETKPTSIQSVNTRATDYQMVSFGAHGFSAHAGTPIVELDRRIFVAHYTSYTNGCSVAAYDAGSGAQLWTTTLQGLGPVEHSKYRNRVSLEVVEGVVVVSGEESAGRYVEVLAPRSGRLLYHRVLVRDEVR